jgi:hypothetical protein
VKYFTFLFSGVDMYGTDTVNLADPTEIAWPN